MYCISESLGYNRQVPANGVTFVTGLAGSLFTGTLFLHNHRHHLLFPYSPAPRPGASGKPASESSPGSLSPGKGRGALGLCKIDDGTRGNVTSFLKLFCNSAKPRHGAGNKRRALPYSVAEKELSRGCVPGAGMGEQYGCHC